MKAAVFKNPGEAMVIETVEDPTPGENDVVIEVKRCGICGTDLHQTESHESGLVAGTVLGHEYVGEVIAAGKQAAQNFKTGDKVTGMPFSTCGRCLPCQTGRPFQCAQLSIVGLMQPGGFAEYVRLDANNSIKVPDSVSWQEGALIEPMAVGLHAVKMAANLKGKNVLVLGAGPVGLAVAYWVRFFGAYNIVVSEPEALRNESALQYGATGTINPANESVSEEFERQCGSAPHVIFECVGIPGMISQCIDFAQHGTELIVVGYCIYEDPIIPAAAMGKEMVMRFALSYHKEDFEFIAGLMASDRVNVEAMCTETVTFNNFSDVFESLRTPNNQCKVLLNPWG
ncbi:MAG: alcohol dehydrogenase catalytic domain-containing protein [Pseudomonadota bacterium]